MTKKTKTIPPAGGSTLSDDRKKYFLQLLDIKSDTNMCRVYSVISSSAFFNPVKK